jgi:hypothetical protein
LEARLARIEAALDSRGNVDEQTAAALADGVIEHRLTCAVYRLPQPRLQFAR